MFREECEPLAYELAFWIQGLEDPDYPLDELGSLTREVCSGLRSLGIMVLLSMGKSDRFQHNLIRSARLRRAYLERIGRANAFDDHDNVSSILEPVMDAIAAGQFDLARGILETSPRDFRPGHEYEDDYCHAQALLRLLQGAGAGPEVDVQAARMERYLSRSDARAAVCRALANADAAAFEEAFGALLQARSEEIADADDRGELAEPPVVAQREVFVEGLAMLRLARARGLPIEPEYQYCPSLALQPMVEPYPDD